MRDRVRHHRASRERNQHPADSSARTRQSHVRAHEPIGAPEIDGPGRRRRPLQH
jgi:hypothetical protein